MERHRALDQLRQAAIFDDLTGVYNRRGFTALAEQHLARARRSGTAITVLFVDVDGLKVVNDTYGHEDGDRLLRDLADLMRTAFRSCDIIGRVGGDEFCALLDGDENAPAATRLRQAIHDHNTTAGRRFHLSCSIGVLCLHPTASSTLGDLLSQADRAMYTEKRRVRASNSADDLDRATHSLP
jgi:diguanylate cyclase (GGDEF)-like protein